MSEIEFIGGRERTFGHGKIVYRIQQIGLALPIVAADAVDIWGKLQFLKLNVPEVRYDYFFEYGHILSDIKAKITKFIGSLDIFF